MADNNMKALVKDKASAGISLQYIPIPEIQSHEVLVKIHKTAICGTDLHIYNWDQFAQNTVPIPMQIGHEFVGEIVKLGSEVGINHKNLNIGTRVSGEGHIVCHSCRNCRAGMFHLCPNTVGVGVNRPGCFAEYLAIPAFNVFILPEYISNNVASMLDPLGNAVHTTLSYDLIGEDVLITGAGPIGCMAVAICKKIGARHIVVTDINDYRLNLAKQMGADRVINVANHDNSPNHHDNMIYRIKTIMQELGMSEGFDVGLEMSGVESSINLMMSLMINGGSIAALGINSRPITFDWNTLIFKSIQLKGIYGREMFETWYKMSSLIKSGLNVNEIITHVLPVDEYLKGFELMKSGKCGKVILEW